MKRAQRLLVAMAMVLPGVGPSLQAQGPTREQTIERSFPATPGSRVVVDSINGSIRVQGYAGDEVRVVVKEELRGRRASDLEQALEDIVLEIDADAREISFYVDTPWRDHNGGWRRWGRRRHRYHFSHQFELQVPYGVALDLRTVNNGDIRVDDARSVVELHNVNGTIEAHGILGITDVSTVNGRIILDFREVPRDGGSVKTINGNVELTFPSTPDAHVRMETFNGTLFSEFAYTYRDVASRIDSRRSDGVYVYRSNGSTEISLGAGGPEWFLKTLNGDIHLRQDGRSE